MHHTLLPEPFIISASPMAAVIPASMMQRLAEILCHIAAGKSTRSIPKNFHRSPNLIRWT
jgi:hypothetical protein